MKKYNVIKRPLITEKGSLSQQTANQYFFAVDPKATKDDIRVAVEDIFKVGVVSVNTLNMPRKRKRVGRNVGLGTAWKKAIVTLKEGDRIEYVEGV